MKKPKKRINGQTVKIWRVINNFEQYYCKERPSEAYLQHYLLYCLREKNIPLSEIKFEIEPMDVFVSHTRVENY